MLVECNAYNYHKDRLFLLSLNEFLKVKDNMPIYDRRIWLRTRETKTYVNVVSPNGQTTDVCHINDTCGVVPAFYDEKAKEVIGAIRTCYGVEFKYVGEHLWVSTRIIFESCFDENTNIYGHSVVRDKLLDLEWMIKLKEESLMENINYCLDCPWRSSCI